MDKLQQTTGTTQDAPVIDTAWHDGGTATLERPKTFQEAKEYAAQARSIITAKASGNNFDPAGTAVGALLLGFEALLGALEAGGPPGQAATSDAAKT